MTDPRSKVDQVVAAMQEEAAKGVKLYGKSCLIDNFCYNWGTGLAILLNSLATIVPNDAPPKFFWAGKIGACLATAWIAIDRLLAFGARWKFSLQQRADFRAVSSGLPAVCLLEEDAAKVELDKVARRIREIHAKDGSFPGIVTGNANGSQ